jgi:hypothetical protein
MTAADHPHHLKAFDRRLMQQSPVKYQDRPAAADIAFCVAAFANGMTEDRIGCALEDDYLSRDPSPSKRAAYIRRTQQWYPSYVGSPAS